MPRWPVRTLAERFWQKVNRTDGCWLWTARRDRWDYGRFEIDRQMRSAHRVAWELTYGAIPDGLCVLHRCDIPACVRPDHLFLGTQTDNMRDRDEKGRHWRVRARLAAAS